MKAAFLYSWYSCEFWTLAVIAQRWCLHPGQLVEYACRAPCLSLKQKTHGRTVHKQKGIAFSARSTLCSLPRCHKFLGLARYCSHRPRTTFCPKWWKAFALFVERCFLWEICEKKRRNLLSFQQVRWRKHTWAQFEQCIDPEPAPGCYSVTLSCLLRRACVKGELQ